MKLLFVFGFIFSSVTAMAADRDLELFNRLRLAGAATDKSVSQIVIEVKPFFCGENIKNDAKSYGCDFTSYTGALATPVGDPAQKVFEALTLFTKPRPTQTGSGFLFTQISCTQLSARFADGTPAERTTCSF